MFGFIFFTYEMHSINEIKRCNCVQQIYYTLSKKEIHIRNKFFIERIGKYLITKTKKILLSIEALETHLAKNNKFKIFIL